MSQEQVLALQRDLESFIGKRNAFKGKLQMLNGIRMQIVKELEKPEQIIEQKSEP